MSVGAAPSLLPRVTATVVPRLAVVFFVTLPLLLWIWSLVKQKGKEDAVKRIMFGYWQAASLLMWTVYLQIGAQPISFATAAAVQVLPGSSPKITDLLARQLAFVTAWPTCEQCLTSHKWLCACPWINDPYQPAPPEMLHIVLTENKASFLSAWEKF